MSELDDLRAHARKRRAAVTSKIARVRRTTGAEVAGSEFDPRKSGAAVNRLNRVQLKAYISRLDSFNSRGNQFVAGASAAPIPRASWNKFKSAMDRHNAIGDRHDNSIGGYKSMNPDVTVSQAKAMLHPTAQGSVGRGPYKRINYEASDIANAGALKKLSADMDSRNGRDFLSKKLKQGRHNVTEALKIMGEDGYMELVNSLSNHQFDVLWYGTRFAEIAFIKYDMEKSRAAGTKKERWQDKVVDNASELIGEFLNWASTEIPKHAPKG